VPGETSDRRRDWHHKASTQIIRDNQAVYVEDLAVAGLARTESRAERQPGPDPDPVPAGQPTLKAPSGGSGEGTASLS
jgi:hypothetical protein